MQIEPEDGSVNGIASSGSGDLETHLSFHSRQNVNRFNDTSDQANGIGDDDKQTTVRRPRSVFDRSMVNMFAHISLVSLVHTLEESHSIDPCCQCLTLALFLYS